MENIRKIKSALISVFSKDGLDELVEILDSRGVKIYSRKYGSNRIQQLRSKIFIMKRVEVLTETSPNFIGCWFLKSEIICDEIIKIDLTDFINT